MTPPRVVFSRFAEKQVRKLPSFIRDALEVWVETVLESGLQKMREIPGYHDEPLHGKRQGQRSARLNRAYRVIYVETVEGFEILIIEVNKHDY